MSHKKLKLISGLLSVTALTSMTGAPVLASEGLQNGFSAAGQTEENSAGAAEEGNSDIDLLGAGTMSVSTGNENSSDFLISASADGQEDAAAPVMNEQEKEEIAAVLAAPLADRVETETVEQYNAMVLPELSVALNKGLLSSRIPGQDIHVDAAQTASKPEAAEENLVVASPNVYLNVHAEPSLGSEILGKMYSNDVAIALRKVDDRWTRIRSGNVVGYVLNEYLVDGDQAKTLSDLAIRQVARVNGSGEGDVYQEANDYSKIFAEAKEGDQYDVTDSEDGWLGIMTEDGEGFIPASEVTLSMAYPVAESSREEADRMSRSNVKERADHEQRKADKADAVAEAARARAEVATGEDEETATAVVEVALRAADAAAAQADVAKVAVSQAGEESGQAVIEFATQYIGNPYVWGGSSLTHGADCSGFVMAVYGNFGFRLPHYDVSDRSVGSPVASLEEARAGDIVCYNGHVALYMGDGMIVHAQDERHGITTSRANFMHIVCIRRLFT